MAIPVTLLRGEATAGSKVRLQADGTVHTVRRMMANSVMPPFTKLPTG